MAADPSAGWWKLTFLRRRKSQPKVLYEIPGEYIQNSPSATTTTSSSSSSVGASPPAPAAAVGAAAAASGAQNDSELNARLERIVDKSSAGCRGRHVKVSHSGRFKEKRRPRAALGRSTDGPSGGGDGGGTPTCDDNLSD